jgi:3-methyl-2-oxobutanoate hydroxymethyltransferase
MPPEDHYDLTFFQRTKTAGRKFAMLTAYDYPTAALAQAAGVHALLVGDSLGTVLLGHPNTRSVPLDLMVVLAEAVRRGAPRVYLVGDLPYEALAADDEAALAAARRFRTEAGCDAVKLEVGLGDERRVRKLTQAGLETIAHLGLRPQQISAPDGYRAQARDAAAIADLVTECRRMEAAGAAMLLLEAVPNEASQAVIQAVGVPVVGCGAGPACDGHVLVTHDLLGFTTIRPPRFVPVIAAAARLFEEGMRKYVQDVVGGRYPAPEHAYHLRANSGAGTK